MKLTVKETRVICSNPDNPYNGYFAWPTVTRLRDGRLAMVASGFRRRHVCPFGKVVICYSRDEGKTWTRPAIIMDTPLDDRDAGILPFGENGIMVTSFNNTKASQAAWNGHGDGWNKQGDPYIDGYLEVLDGEAAEAKYLGSTFILSGDGGTTFGEVKRIPISSPHGPTLMPDGSILYVGRYFTAQSDNWLAAYKVYPDGTYELLGEIPEIAPDLYSCEPHAVVLKNGKILVHIREDRHFTTYQSESVDGGRTFTKPHQILEDRGGAPAHLLVLRDGTLISVYGYREAPFGIKVMASRDGGETWDTGHDLFVSGIHPDLGYPASVELENEDVLTVFYARPSVEAPAVILQTIWHLDEI